MNTKSALLLVLLAGIPVKASTYFANPFDVANYASAQMDQAEKQTACVAMNRMITTDQHPSMSKKMKEKLLISDLARSKAILAAQYADTNTSYLDQAAIATVMTVLDHGSLGFIIDSLKSAELALGCDHIKR